MEYYRSNVFWYCTIKICEKQIFGAQFVEAFRMSIPKESKYKMFSHSLTEVQYPQGLLQTDVFLEQIFETHLKAYPELENLYSAMKEFLPANQDSVLNSCFSKEYFEDECIALMDKSHTLLREESIHFDLLIYLHQELISENYKSMIEIFLNFV